jgi:hypothetical protein
MSCCVTKFRIRAFGIRGQSCSGESCNKGCEYTGALPRTYRWIYLGRKFELLVRLARRGEEARLVVWRQGRGSRFHFPITAEKNWPRFFENLGTEYPEKLTDARNIHDSTDMCTHLANIQLILEVRTRGPGNYSASVYSAFGCI